MFVDLSLHILIPNQQHNYQFAHRLISTKYVMYLIFVSFLSQDRRAEIVRQNKARAAQMEEMSNNEKSAMFN